MCELLGAGCICSLSRRSTSLEGHLARCHYNDKKTQEVKKNPKAWEVRVSSRAIAQLGCICMCCAVMCRHAFRCHLPFLTHVAISLSSAPTTCPLEASSCARGAPRCKLCTPCPTSCFAREAGLRSCCSGCEDAFLVKNLGLALILASSHARSRCALLHGRRISQQIAATFRPTQLKHSRQQTHGAIHFFQVGGT